MSQTRKAAPANRVPQPPRQDVHGKDTPARYRRGMSVDLPFSRITRSDAGYYRVRTPCCGHSQWIPEYMIFYFEKALKATPIWCGRQTNHKRVGGCDWVWKVEYGSTGTTEYLTWTA